MKKKPSAVMIRRALETAASDCHAAVTWMSEISAAAEFMLRVTPKDSILINLRLPRKLMVSDKFVYEYALRTLAGELIRALTKEIARPKYVERPRRPSTKRKARR